MFARLFFLHVTYTNFLPVNIKLIRYGYSRITIFISSPFFFLLSFINVYTMLSFERLSVFLRFIDRRSRGGAYRANPRVVGERRATGSKRDNKGSGAVVVTQLCTVLVCVATKSSLRNLSSPREYRQTNVDGLPPTTASCLR